MATDQSEEMLAAVRRRASQGSVDNIETRACSMESLPFADATFDAVVCRYGLMYSSDPARSIQESARVLKSGGRLAHMVWGPEESNTLLWPVLRALQRTFPGRIPDEEIDRPMKFAAEGVLEKLLSAAGLDDVEERPIFFQPRIRREVPFWTPLVEMNVHEFWFSLDETDRGRAKKAIDEALEPFLSGDRYAFTTCMKIASARKR